MSLNPVPVPSGLEAELSWAALAGRAADEIARAIHPVAHVGEGGLAEVLDRHCLALLAEPTCAELWLLLSRSVAAAGPAPLRIAMTKYRRTALTWAAGLISELQFAGRVAPEHDSETVAALILMAVDGLALTAATDPVSTRACYELLRDQLTVAYARPVTTTGQHA